MTNEITTARNQFSGVLESAGLKVSAFIPERVVPPIVIINSASPYMTASSIGNEYLLNLDLVCVAATATNKQATEKLDELIGDVLNALPMYAHLQLVGQPYIWAVNNAEYLTTIITIDLQITI